MTWDTCCGQENVLRHKSGANGVGVISCKFLQAHVTVVLRLTEIPLIQLVCSYICAIKCPTDDCLSCIGGQALGSVGTYVDCISNSKLHESQIMQHNNRIHLGLVWNHADIFACLLLTCTYLPVTLLTASTNLKLLLSRRPLCCACAMTSERSMAASILPDASLRSTSSVLFARVTCQTHTNPNLLASSCFQ